MPDIPFFVLALVCDVGWLIHLTAGIIYFRNNGFRYAPDRMSIVALAGVILGVAYTIYMNKIHEKEIATKIQKNLNFRLTAYAGLAGGIIGILQNNGIRNGSVSAGLDDRRRIFKFYDRAADISFIQKRHCLRSAVKYSPAK